MTAALNSHGNLVLTSKNTTDVILVGGLYASNVGFGVGNQTFKPTKKTAPAASTPAPATTTSAYDKQQYEDREELCDADNRNGEFSRLAAGGFRCRRQSGQHAGVSRSAATAPPLPNSTWVNCEARSPQNVIGPM